MNNKGFTLVELLATIVILSIIGVIAYTSVLSYINTSSEKAEEKFLNEISTEIDSYFTLYGINKFEQTSNTYTFLKTGTSTTTVWKMKINDDDDKFTLQDLINDLKMADKFQNPRTDKFCNPDDIEIEVYKDSDFVYYYYVDMTDSDIGCTALNDIDTRPDSLKCALGIDEAC